ncbi:MAG: hypothetical protein WCJ31_11910 [Planctomycetia bacterium]
MTLRRSNPGLWLSFGMSLRSVGRPQGSRCQLHTGLDHGALRPLAAGPRSRLALAAALVVASFLSPGSSDACAGCCDDGSPTVVAPLAAGIAPVHTATVVDAAPHRCCRRPGVDAAAAAESCCSSADPGTDLASDGCESPSAQDDPCGCDLVPRDEAPAVPVRTEPDVRAVTAVFTYGFQTTAVVAGRMPAASDGTVLPIHARPLRVLYGVWRN